MEIKDQVVRLKLAEKLKVLGTDQDSHFYWKLDYSQDRRTPYLVACNSRYMSTPGIIIASAYTVSELGKILPASLKKDYLTYDLFIEKTPEALLIGKEHWKANYITLLDSGISRHNKFIFGDRTLADVLARLLIYLKTEKLI